MSGYRSYYYYFLLLLYYYYFIIIIITTTTTVIIIPQWLKGDIAHNHSARPRDTKSEHVREVSLPAALDCESLARTPASARLQPGGSESLSASHADARPRQA